MQLKVMIAAAVGTGLLSFGAASAHAEPGMVYTMSNAASGNEVLAYARGADGSLSLAQTIATGGLGSGLGFTFPGDPLASSGSVVLSADNRWLLAVNAGSDDLSVFSVDAAGHLTKTALEPSGGGFPVSVAISKSLVYVVHAAGSAVIQGFRLDDAGQLSMIEGSTREASPVQNSNPPVAIQSPGQILFDPSGTYLTVIDKGATPNDGRLLVFPILRDGRPTTEPIIQPALGTLPFAGIYTSSDQLLVPAALSTSLASYRLHPSGDLAPVSAPITNNQGAACWVALAGPDEAFAFTTNTANGTVSSYAVGADGTLSLLAAVAGSTGPGSAPIDVVAADAGRFLYTLDGQGGSVPGPRNLRVFSVASDGGLGSVQTLAGLPDTTVGLAAY